MAIEQALASLPPDQWTTRQVVVFDWCDGPRRGICALAAPAVEFIFDVVDERSRDADLDERRFRIYEIAPGSVQETLEQLKLLGVPASSVWIPLWRFPDDASQRHAEDWLQRLHANSRPTSIIISTSDMQHFDCRWDQAIDTATWPDPAPKPILPSHSS